MQKWEYLSLAASWGGADNLLRVVMENGVPVPDWEKGPILHDYLNKCGEQGWELVTEWLLPTSAGSVKWQYYYLWAAEDWGAITIDGHDYKGFSEYFEYIGQLGRDRWELVTAAPQSLSVVDPDTHN